MNRLKRFALPGVVATALIAACASMPAKQKAVTTLQTVEVSLGAAQDFERAVYQAGSLADLTPARHQAIARCFSTAFDAQGKAAIVLKAWRAGDPVPSSLAELQRAAAEALEVAHQLLTSPTQQALVERLQGVLQQITTIVSLLQGGGA